MGQRGGWGLVAIPALKILTIARLTFCLLLTDRSILGLSEYKLKVVNICKMDWIGGIEVVVLLGFDHFIDMQNLQEKFMKKCHNSFIRQFNDLRLRIIVNSAILGESNEKLLPISQKIGITEKSSSMNVKVDDIIQYYAYKILDVLGLGLGGKSV